ncbi:ThiF family adenylyltransferase [Paenibacillus agricola]|uniref:Thiamine biosynthesis protein ThiF n=1 Tax=Paenibacillus agricola TaxID=2716264 RepID=A0ABX0JDC7_9BACL|nr:ThiF family adenylyltransferase [Paenibacillus agricola]NHN33256.1 thiamine biosynthesis protein ThiF [Paenibacillus agricola]
MKSLTFSDSRKPIFNFTIIGTGATGSHFFRGLCQDIRSYLNKPGFDKNPTFKLGRVLLIDGDKVEAKNLGNQLFDHDDIGEPKVISLAERYGEHYNLSILRYPEYVKDLETMNSLHGVPDYNDKHFVFMPVLIGMVDNNATRRLMHDYFYQDELKNLIYIDTGVEAVASEGNTQNINQSGFGGQVVIGFKYQGHILLEPVGHIYSNILEDEEDDFPGCGVQIPSLPQRAATNKTAAQLVNNIVNNLLHSATIYQHVINFNAQFGGCSPVLINKEVKEKFDLYKEEREHE